MNAANIITMGRFGLGILGYMIATAFGSAGMLVAGGLFLVSAMLDKLDGYVARRLNCVTLFGQHLDPIVDRMVLWAFMLELCKLGTFDTRLVAASIIRDLLTQGIWDFGELRRVEIRKFFFGHARYVLQIIAVITGLSAHIPLIATSSNFQAVLSMSASSILVASLILGYLLLFLTLIANWEQLHPR
jgi:CDP-diacylglycerol---glycerol-3-phosphate 3-phosphatidyltransferase